MPARDKYAGQIRRACCPAGVRIEGQAVNRSNILFLIVGALVIVIAVLGYQLYQDRHPPQGVDIRLGPGGISIQGK
jgi:hypothetical protein